MSTRFVYESEDGREGQLVVPPGYSAPETLQVPLLSSEGSGYMVFTRTGVNTDEPDPRSPGINFEMWNMPDVYPHRGDQVEAWIKHRRDEIARGNVPGNTAWTALDDLLDEWRLAADTGSSLEVMVNGEPERPPMGAPKKKKVL